MKKIIKEKDGYGVVQRDFMQMDISVYAKCVYTLLRTYSGQNNSCYPSMRTICDDLKISKSTLIRAIKELEEIEMVAVKRSKKKDSNENSVNTYIPLSIMVEIDLEKLDTDDHNKELGGTPQTPRGITQTLGVVSEMDRKNNIIKNNKEENKKSIKKNSFEEPSLKEVEDFVASKGYNSEYAKKIYEHYSLGDWKDSTGKPVVNWKQKINTNWLNKEGLDRYKIVEENLFNLNHTNGPKMVY